MKHKEKQEKSRRATFVRLMKVLDERLLIYLAAIVVMTGSNACFGIVSSWLLKDILDMAQSGDASFLWSKVLVNMSVGVAAILLWRQACIIYNVEAKRGIARLEKAVFAKSIRLPMAYYEEHHSGDFISRLIFDTGKAGDVFGSRFRRLVAPAISVVVYFIPMVILCWPLALSLLGVSLVTLGINSLFVRPMRKVGKKISEENSHLSEQLTNLIAASDVTKIFTAGRRLSSKYQAANETYRKHLNRQNWLSAALESLNEGLGAVCTLLFLALGVLFVGEGMVTLGSLAAVYSMYGAFNWHFLQLGRYMPEMSNSLVNAARVFEFLDLEPEKASYDIKAAQSDAYISMENVTFSYNEERQILKNFSMNIQKGERVALIGPSGKGKSTVSKLLLGYYEIQSGQISIGGRAYGEYTLKDIRDNIAYVPQEPYLYGVSIAENIAYGREGASMEDIIEAAKAAQAHDFIMKLEQGYETVPGERGSRLSGGEKQRIAIARAILKNAPILILDEATSALDNESEQLVSEALERLMEGKTTIMIAHRPATIARASRVIQMG